MALTKVVPAVIAVTNNITSNTFGSANTIPSFQVDGSGVIIAASNTAITLTANSVANSQFQTGSVENYMRAQGSGAFAGNRNKIINGAMLVDQRKAGTSVTPTDPGYQSLDRYYLSLSSSSKFSIQQNAGSVTPPVGFSKYLGITSLSAFAVGTSEYFQLQQSIEGQNCIDLAWGTASARPITISFWVYSSLTGTFGGSIRNSGDTYGYCYSYTISSANTWEYKTITVAGPISGSWLTTNGVGIDFRFCFGMGTANQGATGSWGGSSSYAPTGQVSIVGTNGATWYMTGLQIEAGTTPTPFEHRSFGNELQLCQRYYEQFGNGWPVRGETTNTSCAMFGNFKVEKRTSPTISVLTSNVRMYEYGVADRDAATVTINSSQMIAGGGTVKLSGWSTIATGTIYVMGYNTSGPTAQPFAASSEL